MTGDWRFRLHACPCCGISVYNYYDKTARCRHCHAAQWSGGPCPMEPRTGHALPAFQGWGDAT